MLDAAKWRQRAEEYNAIAGNCAPDGGRAAYSELAQLCERHAQRLELPSGTEVDGLAIPSTPDELPGNKLLTAMSDADLRLLAPALHPVEFTRHYCFAKPDEPVEHVYFLDEGMASVNALLSEDKQIEAGVIGPEGMTGLAVLLGDDRSPFYTYGEIPGRAFRIATSALRDAMGRSDSLRSLLLRYAHVFSIQVALTALANGRCKIEQRLARWLLMAQDRVRGDLPVTHEFLSVMLGVRRAGITVALHALEGSGLIRVVRGHVSVIDRNGLKTLAGNAYGQAEAAYRRVIG